MGMSEEGSEFQSLRGDNIAHSRNTEVGKRMEDKEGKRREEDKEMGSEDEENDIDYFLDTEEVDPSATVLGKEEIRG